MNALAPRSPAADRFERTCAELTQALANFMDAVSAELRRIESTVAPHSHPPEVDLPAVTDQPEDIAPAVDPVEDSLDVSSLNTAGPHGNDSRADPAPAERQKARDASPTALSPGTKWTAERKALLRETYPTETPLADIHRQLNALPGPFITTVQIGGYAAFCRLKRPACATPPKLTEPAKSVAAPAAFSPETKWTAERTALLREAYSAGVPLAEIHQRINALPGVVVTKTQISIKAAYHGWKRTGAARVAEPAEPAKPAPPAAALPEAAEPAPLVAAPKTPERWTPERIDRAQRLYEKGAAISEIVARLNELPGPNVSSMSILTHAAARNWTRGPVESAAVAAPGAVPASPRAVPVSRPKAAAAAAASPPKPSAGQPVPASAPQIIQWAGERGIVVTTREVPMDLINARRRHLGMAPFVLTRAQRGAVA